MVKTQCPSCGKSLKVREELVRKKLKCPRCQTSFVIAGADAAVTRNGTADVLPPAEPMSTWPEPSIHDKVQSAKAKWDAFYNHYLDLDWSLGKPHLRCCTGCNNKL